MASPAGPTSKKNGVIASLFRRAACLNSVPCCRQQQAPAPFWPMQSRKRETRRWQTSKSPPNERIFSRRRFGRAPFLIIAAVVAKMLTVPRVCPAEATLFDPGDGVDKLCGGAQAGKKREGQGGWGGSRRFLSFDERGGDRCEEAKRQEGVERGKVSVFIFFSRSRKKEEKSHVEPALCRARRRHACRQEAEDDLFRDRPGHRGGTQGPGRGAGKVRCRWVGVGERCRCQCHPRCRRGSFEGRRCLWRRGRCDQRPPRCRREAREGEDVGREGERTSKREREKGIRRQRRTTGTKPFLFTLSLARNHRTVSRSFFRASKESLISHIESPRKKRFKNKKTVDREGVRGRPG